MWKCLGIFEAPVYTAILVLIASEFDFPNDQLTSYPTTKRSINTLMVCSFLSNERCIMARVNNRVGVVRMTQIRARMAAGVLAYM